MDKFKEFMANVQKYHFWILCGTVVVVAFISWYMAISSLDDQTRQNADAIKGKDGEIQAVKNTPDHPNDNFAKGMDGLITPFSAQIGLGWDKRYEHQKNLLVWPEALTKEAEGFVGQVDHLRPIEKIPYPTPQDQEIENKYLLVYRYFITRELPRLAEMIGAKWYVQTAAESKPAEAGNLFRAAAAGTDGSGQRAEVDNSMVYWNEANQKEILEIHFGFASKNQTPTTLEVLYAQEDLWVLEALMHIIKKTNERAGSDASYNAAIKELHSIQIGRTARGRMGKVQPIRTRQDATAHGPGGPGGPGGAMPASPTPGGPGGAQGPAPSDLEKADPAFERYVDIDYNPLPISTLRNAATSTDPKIAIYSVAKRIPVRMRLLMDQRYLSDLLAQCGNFNLPVEVRQVRINCQEGLSSDDFSLTGSNGPSLGGRMGGDGGGMSGPGRASAGGGGGRGNGKSRRPTSGPSGGGIGVNNENEAVENANVIEVEVYGIVYIFNPVNEKQLGIELQRPQEASREPAPSGPPTAVLPGTATPRG